MVRQGHGEGDELHREAAGWRLLADDASLSVAEIEFLNWLVDRAVARYAGRANEKTSRGEE